MEGFVVGMGGRQWEELGVSWFDGGVGKVCERYREMGRGSGRENLRMVM